MPRLPDPDPHVLRGDGGGEPAAGPDESQAGVLARAAAARFPDLKGGGRGRVEALVDYISEISILRGDVEELRLEAHVALRDHRSALDATPTSVTRNKAAIDEAKRQARPDLAALVDDAQWLVQRCTEQIARLSADYDAASRSYTLISGT